MISEQEWQEVLGRVGASRRNGALVEHPDRPKERYPTPPAPRERGLRLPAFVPDRPVLEDVQFDVECKRCGHVWHATESTLRECLRCGGEDVYIEENRTNPQLQLIGDYRRNGRNRPSKSSRMRNVTDYEHRRRVWGRRRCADCGVTLASAAAGQPKDFEGKHRCEQCDRVLEQEQDLEALERYESQYDPEVEEYWRRLEEGEGPSQMRRRNALGLDPHGHTSATRPSTIKRYRGYKIYELNGRWIVDTKAHSWGSFDTPVIAREQIDVHLAGVHRNEETPKPSRRLRKAIESFHGQSRGNVLETFEIDDGDDAVVDLGYLGHVPFVSWVDADGDARRIEVEGEFIKFRGNRIPFKVSHRPLLGLVESSNEAVLVQGGIETLREHCDDRGVLGFAPAVEYVVKDAPGSTKGSHHYVHEFAKGFEPVLRWEDSIGGFVYDKDRTLMGPVDNPVAVYEVSDWFHEGNSRHRSRA